MTLRISKQFVKGNLSDPLISHNFSRKIMILPNKSFKASSKPQEGTEKGLSDF
jgi:hypothetical protein